MKQDNRYNRQISMPDIGTEGQEKIRQASILVIGAGGIGCPLIQTLAACGVGRIGIIDNDRIELSNLHRQILFQDSDIGAFKAEVAADKAQLLQPGIHTDVYVDHAGKDNLLELIRLYDLTIDASDSILLRYQLSDACGILNKPWIYGSCESSYGQIALFAKGSDGTRRDYRDLFPFQEAMFRLKNCNESGVFPGLTGIIGNLQAAEAIKWVTGNPETLCNKVLMVDMLTHTFEKIEIAAGSDESRPGHSFEYKHWSYMQENCSIGVKELTFDEVQENLNQYTVIDVRELFEEPEWTESECHRIPMKKLLEEPEKIKDKNNILICCQSGKRSLQTAEKLQKHYPDKYIVSLKNGIQSIYTEYEK